MSSARPRYLLCDPAAFNVRYVINPWMEGNIDRPRPAEARRQWEALRDALVQIADVEVVHPEAGLPDMVFAANGGAVLENTAILSRFQHDQRRGEEEHWERWFREHGFDLVRVPEPLRFEGAGDALFDRRENLLWAGYGFRTSLEAHRFLAETFEIEVVSLRLTDPRFYHLDMALCPLSRGDLLYYPPAFDRPSLEAFESRVPPERRIAIGKGDALDMVCNAVECGDTLILHRASDALKAELASRGHRVIEVDLSEFQLSGGSARCLSLRLDERRLGPPQAVSTLADQVVELGGHLINSGLMAEVLDRVTEGGGSFDILEFLVGQRPEDPSHLRLRITAPRPAQLRAIVTQILASGAQAAEREAGVRLEGVTKPGVAPPDFTVTTIYPTEVLIDSQWIPVENQRMDGVIVVSDARGPQPTARCCLLRDLAAGDLVVCGLDGVRVRTDEKAGPRRQEFAFMSSGVSSERRVELSVEQVAWEMQRLRERGGRIVVVPGPVVIHTGGGPHLAALIREGFVQALLGGNAVAVHDIEQAIYGTSLGVDLRTGAVVEGGHRHHLRVINEVRGAGGIAAAVEAGLIRGGVMFECVGRGVPFVLAGSIRDDGPLPETLMNLVEAQSEYARHLRGAQMVLLLSSMLHSIGVGNMTPAGVRLICVDISPAVVTKLADRGSLDALGVVTDVGLFLTLLTEKLGIGTQS